MPIPAAFLTLAVEPVTHDVSERWTMAYAAALGDHSECYFDTTRPEGIVAHPLFTVCPEWAAIVASRSGSEQIGMTAAEVPVHGERVDDPLTVALELSAGAAPTYTECARIWNPIHTDRAVAQAAGLPDIIVHGTIAVPFEVCNEHGAAAVQDGIVVLGVA